MIYVALAGPVSNVILAWVFLTYFNLLSFLPTAFTLSLVTFLNINIAYNLGLAAFNLIPIPPLDGSKILGGLLPPKYAFAYARISEYAPLILIILLVTGGAQFVIGPIYRLLLSLISIISI